MGFSNGQQITDEVYFRIGGRLTTSQILPYVNRSLALIEAAGSYSWDFHLASGTPVGGIFTPPSSMDAGKKISVVNQATQTPVSKILQGDVGTTWKGYVDIQATEYNAFYVLFNASVAATIQCLPANVSTVVDVYYHDLPPVLTYGASPTLRWNTPWMDDVLIDFTEALLSRIFKWTGYAELEANAKARVIEAAKIYSTERINTGPLEEATTAEQEKQTVGRV